MKTLAVLGTGTMGAGIAQVAAQAGHDVQFWNRREASVEKGLAKIQKGLGRLLKKERISQADHDAAHDAALARISGTATFEDVKTADLVIETASTSTVAPCPWATRSAARAPAPACPA